MRRGIVMLVWLFAAALLAACDPTTGAGPAGPTLTAMAAPVAFPDTPLPAADTPAPTSPSPSLPSGGTLEMPTSTLASASGTPAPAAQAAACQGQIAFIRRERSDYGIYTVRADGSDLVELVADPGSVYSLSISPDGAHLLYVAQKEGVFGVYIADRRGQERVLDFGGYGADPAWAADGEHVLVVASKDYRTNLYLVGLDGGEAQQITDSASHKTGPAWSPDGGWIAFTMLDAYNQGDVWLMPAPGRAGAPEAVNLTQNLAHDCCVAWSPDGTRLAFLSSRADEGARPSAGDAYAAYGWTETLVRVAYEAGRLAPNPAPRPLTTVVSQPPRDIYLLAPDGSGLLNLTSGAGREGDPAWSPDGRRLAFVSDRDGSKEIYVANADGSGEVRLTRNADDDFSPLWSPDGACLAFVSYREGAYGIYLLSVPTEADAEPAAPWKLVDGGTGGGGLGWCP